MSAEVDQTVKLSSLVRGIKELATCSESENVNLEALMTFGQILSPTPNRFGRRVSTPFSRSGPMMTIVDDGFEDEPED